MSNQCQLTGKKLQFGNNVSHSKRRTRRKFLPNTQSVNFLSELLGKISLKITTSTIRTVDKNGGIDNFLENTKAVNLAEDAQRLKRRLSKAKTKQAKANA